MRTKIEKTISIPEGIEVMVEGRTIKMKKGEKEIEKEFALPNIEIVKGDSEVKILCEKATRREAKVAGTIEAHLKNMVRGLQEDFVYKMEVCNIHFPMTVKVEGDLVSIKSFLGEASDRKAKILPGVNVEVKGTDVSVSSHNIENAGQTAANIEKATRLSGKDRRIFQDGIFITEKPGREI